MLSVASRPIAGSRLHMAGLVLCAAASAAVSWVTFTRHMWLPAYYAVPHLDTPRLLGVSTSSMVSFASAAGAQLAIYLTGLWLVSRLKPTGRVVLALSALALLLSVPLLLAYPGGAGDVYAYIAEADAVLRFHVNPFQLPVASIPAHPLLPFLDYPNETTHYGPLWMALALALRALSGPDLLPAVIVFKTAAMLSLVGVGWLAYLTLRPSDPRAALQAALLVSWNPLLVFELAENAHNDVAMMLLVSLAFYMQSRGRQRAAIAALIAACLVKYVAAILLPLFLLVDLKGARPWREWARAVLRDAVLVGIVAGCVAAVAGIRGTVGILETLAGWFTTSAGAAVYYWLIRSMPAEEAGDLVGNASKALFGLVYLAIIVRLWLRPNSLIVTSLWATLAFMAIETSWFQPWYVAWALPLAVLASTPVARGVLAGMTIGGFAIHLVMGFAWRLEWNHGSLVAINTAGAIGMWAPVVLLAGWMWLLQWRRASRGSLQVASPEPIRSSVGSRGGRD